MQYQPHKGTGMARVVTSDRAEELVGRLLSQIGTANDQLQTMLGIGDELGSPEIWEGQAANRFRDEWQQTKDWTNNSIRQLETLQENVRQINDNIRVAGGDLG